MKYLKSFESLNTDRYDYIDISVIMDILSELRDIDNVDVNIYKEDTFLTKEFTSLRSSSKFDKFEYKDIVIEGYVDDLKNILIRCLDYYYNEMGKEIICYIYKMLPGIHTNNGGTAGTLSPKIGILFFRSEILDNINTEQVFPPGRFKLIKSNIK